jgi:hypothetical protein
MTLFSRNPGASQCPHFTARCWAHRVLDRAKAGLPVDAADLLRALKLTGDAQ